MWFLCFMSVVNAITSARGFQNLFRISLGGIEIGVLEGTLTLVVIVALFRGSSIRAKTPTDRVHPVYVVSLTMMMAAFVIGSLLALTNTASMHEKLVFIREFFGMPASLFAGYQLVGTIKSGKKFIWSLIVAGIGVSIMLMAFFNANAEKYELHGDLGAMRTVSYVTNYAGVACSFLIFTALLGLRVMPLAITLAIAGFCFVGQLTPLHRSDWLSQAVALAAIPLMMPPGARVKQVIRMIAAGIALALSLWVGLYGASAVTGKNFHKTFEDRLVSMMPGERVKASDEKAWDTRLPAIAYELSMWLQSPLWGNGFASEEASGINPGNANHHNAYTSTLAQTGLLGTIGVVLAVWSPIFVGLRLVRQRYDKTSVLIGALGVIAGVQFAVLGAATASFNGYRDAMLIGAISGVCFRVRDMQATALRLAREHGIPYGVNIDPETAVPNYGFDDMPIPEFDDNGRPIAYPSNDYAGHGYPTYY